MGLSRKRFIESVSPAKPSQRLGGSIAGNVMAVLAGADVVRVHDVAETVQALRVMAAIEKAR
jgi:dihydropteroate synthase